MTNLLIYLKTKQAITPHYKTQGLPVPSNGHFKIKSMNKIPKPILLYLLALEMLPLLDEMNASNSILKAVRTIENFAANSFKEIEKHPKLAPVVNDEMVQQFSQLIDNIEIQELKK